MSIVGDSGQQMLLLVRKVGEYYEIMEFEEKFSDFTGLQPDVLEAKVN